jgi:hypothetical protein
MLSKTFNKNISGIIPYENYFYFIEKINSNWPVKIIPESGSINSFTSDVTIDSKIYFCDTIAGCGDYLPYTTGLYKIGDDPFIDLRLKLTSDILDNPVYSTTTTIECSGCAAIPSISIDSPFFAIVDSDRTSINFICDNLKPFTIYNYHIKDVNSNYPILIKNIPLSGSFTTQQSNAFVLRVDTVFCSDQACAEDSVIGSGNILKIGADPCSIYFASFNLELTSNYLLETVISPSVKMECDNCLPKITINIPPRINLNSATTNTINIITNLSGLKPNNVYNYLFEYVNGNHSINILPLSGSFYATSFTEIITNRLSFCESSGLCDAQTRLGTLLSGPDTIKNALIRFKLDADCLDDSVYSLNDTLITCDNCFSQTTIETPSNIYLTSSSGNVYSFETLLTNLKPYSVYNYKINHINSNHLIGFKNLSGTIQTTSNTSATIDNKIIFCESSGYCSSYHTTGLINSDVCNNILFSNFKLELDSNKLDVPIYTDLVTVSCDNCLPKLNVSLHNNTTLTSTNLISLTGTVSGLRPFEAYNYYFVGDNNWPVVLDNVSGSFVAKTTTENIVTKLLFCSPSGSCAGESGLLPYTTSSSTQKTLNNNNLYSKLRLNVRSTYCNDTVYSSNISTINCRDCLPCVRYANTLFIGSPTITLPDGCCSGQKLLTVNITNAIPGDRYLYEFSTSSGIGVNNIEFNPTTGEMYFGSGGIGTINSICDVDLIDNTQTLINFELTHEPTNTKVLDSIGLICNTGICI